MFRKLYFYLCAQISNALDCLPRTVENEKCRFLLETAMQKAEELYMENGEKNGE